MRTKAGMMVIAAVVAACGVVGCSGSTARVQYDKTTDFTALKQYAWREGKFHGVAQYGLNEAQVGQMIREAVDAGLGAKGYRPAPGGAADFVVTFQAAVEQKLAYETINEPYMRSSMGGTTFNDPVMSMAYGTQTYEYDAGTLVIDIVDPKTQKLLWRGAAERVVRDDVSADMRRQRIKAVVDDMLKRFPPK